MFSPPIFVTNFKNYENAAGAAAVDLAKIHERVAQKTGATLAVAVSPIDVFRVSRAVSIPVFSQHVDAIDFGKFTGKILPQNLKKSGAVGSILNHSENRINSEILPATISLAKKSNLSQILCAENPDEIENFAALDPDFLAFEPPELIGSTKKSVASENPASIEKSVQKSRGIPILVGAGVNSPADIKIALKLGAAGFLVATAVVKNKNPEKKLLEFVAAF